MSEYHLVNLETAEVEFILDLLKDSPNRDATFVKKQKELEAKLLLMLERDAL